MKSLPMSLPVPFRLSLLLALTLLGACSPLTRSAYTPVSTQTPLNWQQRSDQPEADVQRWWQGFGDATLTALIDEALRKNNDLALAAIKLRRAQLQAGLADDAFVPALSASLGASSSKQLDGDRITTRASQSSVKLSYEVDLWGRLAATSDLSRWEALATEQDRQSAALTLIGTTANLYWTGAYLNQRLATAEQSIAYAEKTLELVRTQYQAGAVSSVEVLSAQQNLYSQQSSYTELVQQRVENDNALSILFDQPPGKAIALPARLPEQALPVLAAGVPAQLLGRRPDLRALELRIRSTLAGVDQARLNYYPQLSLTGTLGTSSDALLRLVQNPVATLGGALTLPFLQHSEMKFKVGISQADFDSAVVNFRKGLYTAFSEVENALSARQQYARQQALLVRNLDAAQAAERLLEVRYRAGSATLQLWLDQQDKRRTAEISLAQVRLNQLKNQMTLYQALGGDANVPAAIGAQ
nr:efflux transporter outer membrane subunit [Herbaspirillum camelliae]